MVFTTLANHIDLEWLLEAYRRTRTGGAAGVGQVTTETYAEHPMPTCDLFSIGSKQTNRQPQSAAGGA